jgi:light-regulated signal transduction histidine kinase (bacteriophytochrome)
VPFILGDRIQLQQVILNLILNAIEAMSGQPARKLLVASDKEGSNGALVIVRDSGIGLDGTAPDRLLEVFCTIQSSWHRSGSRGRSKGCRSPWRVAMGHAQRIPRDIPLHSAG